MIAAIIGTGHIAGGIDEDRKRKNIWSHAGAYRHAPGVTLAAACDTDPRRLRSFGKRWGVPHLYCDHRRMLSERKVDIVSICTPTSAHWKVIREVSRFDVKAIFCEKPLAFSHADCLAAVGLCRRRNILLAVNYFRRWDNLYLKIRDIIASGRLGRLRTVTAYANTALYMSASHMIDLILMLCGPIASVWGRLDADFVRIVHGQKDPGGVFHFATRSGVSGMLVAAGDSPRKHQFEVDLQFTGGRLRSSHYGTRNELFTYRPSPQLGGLLELAPARFPSFAPNERLVDAVKNIAAAIKDPARPLACGGEEAAESVRVIEAFRRASRTRGVVTL